MKSGIISRNGVGGLELSSGGPYYLKGCKNITLRAEAKVAMCHSAQVGEMRGSATVRIAVRWADGVKPETFILCDNATVKDNRTKTLYQSGDWKMVIVENNEEKAQ